MKKLVYIGVVLVIIIGSVSGVASAKTLFVVGEDEISNNTSTPADAFAVDVKLTTYNNQCMTLAFSTQAAVNGTGALQIEFLAEIDGEPASPTGPVFFTPSFSGWWDMAQFTWYKCGLAIGRHTVAIRYYRNLGDIVYIGTRLLKIDITAGKIVPPLTTGVELENE